MTKPSCRYLIVAEDINMVPHEGTSKMLIVQPVINFLVPFIPTQLSFSVTAIIGNLEQNVFYNNELRIIDPNGESISSHSWEYQEETTPEQIGIAATIAANLKNMVVQLEGTYRLTLWVNDEYIGETKFDIVKKK